jgi:hypothetical protein
VKAPARIRNASLRWVVTEGNTVLFCCCAWLKPDQWCALRVSCRWIYLRSCLATASSYLPVCLNSSSQIAITFDLIIVERKVEVFIAIFWVYDTVQSSTRLPTFWRNIQPSLSGLYTTLMSRDSSVGIATGYGLEGRAVGVRVPSPLHVVQTDSEADPASNPIGTGGSLPGGKSAGAWSWAMLQSDSNRKERENVFWVWILYASDWG